ncbi:formimidoylglutamase [Lentibacillus saliphilus]|uniref:formimidoylglutamase n=1 Tax=Lentibacillus saliphilus TaxID=2737028 RepID=UPI001C2F9BD0|nr:formimidoylglutamase [Lentibacillus saliphilus]
MKQVRHLQRAGSARFVDRYTTKADTLLQPWTGEDTALFGLVGLPLSKPSISHSGASLAPAAIRDALKSYSTYSGETDSEIARPIIDFGDFYMNPTDVIGNQQRLYEGMYDLYETRAAEHMIMLGGDHSISHATIKALSQQGRNVGVIQFDAHHDVRNVEDGGPTNGTPFRRLLEEDAIKGDHLVQIGIRDFTNAKAYADYVSSKGVHVYTMADVYRQSMEMILEAELTRLTPLVDEIYLSVDMDVLDQAFAPGCPAIGPGGMDSRTLLEGIRAAARHKCVRSIDFVEIDPTIDSRNMTSRIAAYGILQFLLAKEANNS